MKEKIFEKSIVLFGKNGFTETSIQHIVEELGVTKGTFYYYFTSKEELLMEIHLRFINELLQSQKAIVEDELKSAKEKLHGIVYMLLKNIEGQGQSAKVFFREMQNLNEEHLQDIFKKRDQFRKQTQHVIEKGMEMGEFRQDINAEIITLAILGAANWGYHWYDPKGPLTELQISDIYLDFIINGIQA
ncbi:TetR/AcrR family transcriptional regulator [Alkalihalobacillus sp. LMS39]|uniref:TetR/AcrR family transcriptional regulator n=1 Tax=Alkalihalobacillus sp. LMS39 TaxID=2924032 RepID=UPI001FB2EC8C|nr:TetR/AcrR family transcriptional regulator [Alkalihalobacillus sp. LMS39]UOE95652.1 TetR/AcrR family transcriptional regulator [Alkalihalobacillus sp. LMS39]